MSRKRNHCNQVMLFFTFMSKHSMPFMQIPSYDLCNFVNYEDD